jgi:hypothetical protein
MDNELKASKTRARSKSKSSSSSGSKGTQKNKPKSSSHTATARTATISRTPIGKKEIISELDDEFEVVGSTTTRSVSRPRLSSSKSQRKQASIHRPRVLVSSKIRKQGANFKITREYSDGTKENEVIITDDNKPVRLVFQKHKEVRSERGWPGVKTTNYFSDGRIEESKDWKYNKEWR